MPPVSPSTHRPFLLATAGFNYVAAAALLVWPLWFDALGVRPSPDNGLWLVLFAGAVAGRIGDAASEVAPASGALRTASRASSSGASPPCPTWMVATNRS